MAVLFFDQIVWDLDLGSYPRWNIFFLCINLKEREISRWLKVRERRKV